MTTPTLTSTPRARLVRRHTLAVAALTIACLLSAACGAAGSSPYTLPAGWHDITPSAQSLVSYAISPDVPGLIAGLLTISHSDTRTQPCGPDCTTIEYPGPDTPHLIWANVP